MESMKSNKIWELVELPLGHKKIRNKWILKIKHKADSYINIYKVYLVVKGYTQ